MEALYFSAYIVTIAENMLVRGDWSTYCWLCYDRYHWE